MARAPAHKGGRVSFLTYVLAALALLLIGLVCYDRDEMRRHAARRKRLEEYRAARCSD